MPTGTPPVRSESPPEAVPPPVVVWLPEVMVVATADWLKKKMFEQAVEKASRKLGEPPSGLRLEKYAEGKSVQIMHVGPPGTQAAPIARLHNQFLPAHNLVPNGHHHEIYLNDPRRVAPEKLRTVLRQPVRLCGKTKGMMFRIG